MSELQGAVAVAQVEKLEESVRARIAAADWLTERLRGLPGIETPCVDPRNMHTYWRYCLRVDGRTIAGGAPGLARLLKDRGIASAPRYIQKPAFRCAVFDQQRTFGRSRFPFTLARPEAVDYRGERFPGTFEALEGILVLPWNERYTAEHVGRIAGAILEAAALLTEGD